MAIRTTDPSGAVDFDHRLLGFPIISAGEAVTELDASSTTLFVIADDQVTGAVHELFVPDLEAARDELVANGCEVVRWHGKGQDCYIRDPFGVMFNL